MTISQSFKHGLIQLDYGISMDNKTMICEGLAYIHHSYAPLVTSNPTPDLTQLGQGSLDILEVMGKFNQDTTIQKHMMDQQEPVTCRKTSYIQHRIYVMFTKKGDPVIDYVNQIKFPAVYKPKAPSIEQLDALLKWLIDCTIFSLPGGWVQERLWADSWRDVNLVSSTGTPPGGVFQHCTGGHHGAACYTTCAVHGSRFPRSQVFPK